MGCASSKQKKVCRNCKGSFSPTPTRSKSMHVHHPPEWFGDSYHVVGVTSSTIGSIKLDGDNNNEKQKLNVGKDFSLAVVEAKTWSEMLDKKIPKILPMTPIRTPPGEPEPINAWELMEGLDDITPLRPGHQYRSFSFRVEIDNHNHNEPAAKPLWLEMAEEESNLNSNLTTKFRKSLEDLSPSNPFHIKSMNEHELVGSGSENEEEEEEVKKNSGKDRVVLYFTSLRGVRKTYEDCCHVREILKSLGIRVDERDVSMHSGFKEELKELIGDQDFKGMPRVFIGNKHIGGAEEIRRMHEEGELEKEVENCERIETGSGSDGGGICEACGDIRFVPCDRCSGSCKIYCEEEDEEKDDNYQEQGGDDDDDEKEYGFQRCPDCNENGLIRCPNCCI
ncbi:uncharacterized protein At3g28850-like [Impatiens glandulifera]|uniref:uncharacterized protein At3g28850-like n=1 Tax=Impatiens glandulifera TaxID=253017 RepID=UPI001FB0FE01|nr:uncharacterized protein At3g28850-like [Impatiens glandulifera]